MAGKIENANNNLNFLGFKFRKTIARLADVLRDREPRIRQGCSKMGTQKDTNVATFFYWETFMNGDESKVINHCKKMVRGSLNPNFSRGQLNRQFLSYLHQFHLFSQLSDKRSKAVKRSLRAHRLMNEESQPGSDNDAELPSPVSFMFDF